MHWGKALRFPRRKVHCFTFREAVTEAQREEAAKKKIQKSISWIFSWTVSEVHGEPVAMRPETINITRYFLRITKSP